MKVLQIVETAYRATIEEQDDTVIWITHAMKGAGGDLDVLLTGNAVNYVLPDQDASGLSFGDWQQTQPPQLAGDVKKLTGKGVQVFVVEEDLEERGLNLKDTPGDFQSIGREHLPRLFGEYDQIWHW